ncbi:MAG: aquaporin [Chloroflexota bacterium]
MRTLLAEGLGTFAIVFAGCGAIAIDGQTGQLGHMGIAATFALVVVVMIYALGHISGAHFNPAVTIAFAVGRHFPWPRTAGYVAVQVAGATLAALALRLFLGDNADLGVTQPSGSDLQSFGWEIVLTFFLMLVIVAVATDIHAVAEAAALAIGGTVGLCALFGGAISGASMNPARSLGPALVSGDLDAIWIYLTAPVIGATLAVMVYRLLRAPAPTRVPAGRGPGTRSLAAPASGSVPGTTGAAPVTASAAVAEQVPG